MDMSDPLTADFPTRNADQDEETAAMADAQAVVQPPAMFWESAVSSAFVDGKLHIKQLVLATSPASCQLFRHCCSAQQAVGVIIFQEQAQGATFALPSSADKMYFMFLLPSSDQNSPSQQTQVQRVPQPNPIFEHIKTLSVQDNQHNNSNLLVFCPTEVQPERATSWLKGLMRVVQPQHILVTASLPAFSYRGPGDPSEEALHFVVQTAAAKEQTKKGPQLPQLPSGSLITGLAAAAIQYAEVRQLSATALVGVEARPVPDQASLQQLAHCTSDILKAYGSTFLQPAAVLKAVKEAGKGLAAAASNNFMYI